MSSCRQSSPAKSSCSRQASIAGAFTLTAAAEDLEDLRKALDVPRWNLISYGTASRILLEYMRRHSSHVRALVLDSPQMPRFDPVSEASANMTAAFDALAKTCRSSSACDQKYPDLASTLAKARTELSRSPVTVSAGGTGVTIDHTALVRVVRHVLSGSDERAWIVPRLVHNAAAGDVRAIAAALSAHPGMCLGYLPRCDQPVSLGAYLSFVCPLMPSAVASPVYGEAFGAADPYRAACRVWDLPSSASRAQIRTEVPALVLRGQYDAFSSATLIPQTTRTMPNAQHVTVPGTGHDVLEDECLRDARNDWLLHPGSAPNVEGCL